MCNQDPKAWITLGICCGGHRSTAASPTASIIAARRIKELAYRLGINGDDIQVDWIARKLHRLGTTSRQDARVSRLLEVVGDFTEFQAGYNPIGLLLASLDDYLTRAAA